MTSTKAVVISNECEISHEINTISSFTAIPPYCRNNDCFYDNNKQQK
ncbi:MAG: hypothetical protein LBV72_11650 [Tannerella sp.]|jgi:hypothetical protein|nr:hypothetical protein [Tannerella sp.]